MAEAWVEETFGKEDKTCSYLFLTHFRSMILGVGTPPMDTFSPLVLGIMAVALGAPTLMLLAGGLFLMLGPKRYSEYQAIN